MGRDLVEEQERRLTAAAGNKLGVGQHEAEQQRFLFAGRAMRGRRIGCAAASGVK